MESERSFKKKSPQRIRSIEGGGHKEYMPYVFQ